MKKIILIMLVAVTVAVAQSESETDSTALADLVKTQRELVASITKQQSDLYEKERQLKGDYARLNRVVIAIQLYEEKLKKYKPVEEKR